jgi:hypothetical protein
MGSVARITATIDGREVQGAGMRWSSAGGGYHRASLRIPELASRRLDVSQGSILKLWQSNGRPAFEGRIALRPYYRREEALIEANGYKVAAEKAHGRLLYQVRDLSVWADATLPPHSYAVPANHVTITTAPGNALVIEMTNPDSVSRTFTALIAVWFPGATITRYAYSLQSNDITSHSIATSRAMGPAGTRTAIATHTTSPVDQAVTSGEDMLVFEVSVTVPAVADTATMKLFNLRINDAGTTTDVLYTSELVADVGTRLGWDTSGVQATAIDVMPLDISSGSWAEGALDYAAGLDDWQWRVLDDAGTGPRLQYTAWEREWKVSQADGARVGELAPLEVFNRVIVLYADDLGVVRQVSKDVTPDPLGGRYTNTFEFTIPGRQADDALAEQVAAVLLPEVSRERWSGSVDVTKVRGSGTPHDIVYGDLLTITDWDQGEAKRLRVASTDAGIADVGVGLEQPSSASSVIARSGLGRHPLASSFVGGTRARRRRVPAFDPNVN